MPWSALPDHINSPEEWAGTDHDQWWGSRWLLKIKGWMAFGPRATEGWARWRRTPFTLFAIRGKGRWRFEDDGNEVVWKNGRNLLICPRGWGRWYLSRCQYYTRWHVAVQWPLQITAHVYWKAADVPEFPKRPRGLSWRNMLFGYGPVHRDADAVYWFPSGYSGGRWK